jgi:crotonobetaine/carnitine-CoA ligase
MKLLSVPQLLGDAAARFGDAPFLIDADGTHSFAQAADAAAAGAGWLRARGVAPGDRVLLAGGNSAATVIAWLSAVHAGAWPAAVNPALTAPELDYLADDLRPAFALADAASADALRAIAAPRGIALGGIGAALEAGRLGEHAERIAAHDAAPSDVAAIVYTSGTTSRPKGAMVRHVAYTGAGQSMPSWIGLGAHERLWCVLPFFHINAQAYSTMTALAHGYPLTISPKFRASTFWSDAAALDVTEVNLIGAMLAILHKQPTELYVPNALRTLYCAPALDPPTNRALEQRFGVRVTSGFGMSENTFGCVQSATSIAKASCIGRPRVHPEGLIPNEIRIVDPERGPVARGESGELQFRNAAVTPGYWNAPEITERTLVDGWLRTGDAGRIDEDGDVVLVGRYKEMIRRRGENIAPREVEDALEAHASVAQAAVIGVPSSLSEEDVVGCVIASPGATPDEASLRAWCAERLAPFKVPLRIFTVAAFPLTPTMRVEKTRLREQILPLLAEAAP